MTLLMASRPVAFSIVAMYVVLAALVLLVRQSDWTLGLIYVGLFIAGFGIILTVSLFLWNTELLVIYVAGQALFNWAGVTNPFFEKTVRIQEDQGHYVTDRGPYAIVRHPWRLVIRALYSGCPT